MKRREYIVEMALEAIKRLVGTPGPTPKSAVKMCNLRDYKARYYPHGEFPLTLEEMIRPDQVGFPLQSAKRRCRFLLNFRRR